MNPDVAQPAVENDRPAILKDSIPGAREISAPNAPLKVTSTPIPSWARNQETQKTEEIPTTFRVALNDGTTESVTVREVKFEEYPALLEAIGDDLRQCEIYCNREVGWGKKLTPMSAHLVLTVAEHFNGEPFSGWVRRRMEKLRILAPIEYTKITTALSK